jgi:hypothetical protein
MISPSSAADGPPEVPDQVDEAALAEVMRVVPLGAGVLAGAAVALLVLGYLGWRSMSGTMPATSQLDRLISITAISVLSWSRTVRHLRESLATWLGADHVSVTSVTPGGVLTRAGGFRLAAPASPRR